jgi:catechol 2,3-dioxygenase-like lactoylglutathione lyase family enzyme
MLLALDHVNIRTARLADLRRFYVEALGLSDGPRPPFSFDGAWLYCAEQAAVHLVEVAAAPTGREPRIEHFAFRAAGLADFLARLRRVGAAYQISIVPGSGNRQVNILDPDGNHIEVQFAGTEEADLSAFAP